MIGLCAVDMDPEERKDVVPLMATSAPPTARVRILPLVALLLSLTVVVMACGSTTSNEGVISSDSNSNSNSTSASAAKHFSVGDQVKVGDTWMVTINSATTHGATDLDQPKSGNRYLVIDATFENLSSAEQHLSTLLQLSLKDATGQKYNNAFTSFASQPPDGKVQVGDVVRGQVVYEAPTAQKSFTLAFESDLLSSGQVIWDINV